MQERLGISPTVTTSDDPAASEKISRFADGIAPWIVAVRMVSEGVDIPRLRVGVYATNTVTELFFRQAVGRLVRWNARLAKQAAYMFIPDDIRLRKFGAAIAEQRRHCLRKESRADDGYEGERDGEPAAKKTETERDLSEQLSLFAPISATPLDEHGRPLEQRPHLPGRRRERRRRQRRDPRFRRCSRDGRLRRGPICCAPRPLLGPRASAGRRSRSPSPLPRAAPWPAAASCASRTATRSSISCT